MDAPHAIEAGLAQEMAAPLESVIELLAAGWPAPGEIEPTLTLLGSYLHQVERIAEAADLAHAQGLVWVCSLMEGQLLRLRAKPETITNDEQALLVDWPILLTDYLAAPEEAATSSALIAHLQDQRWGDPLSTEDAESLRGMFPTAADCAAAFAEDPQQESLVDADVAAPAEPAGAKLARAPQAPDVDYAVQLADIAEQAEARGLLGLGDACLRVQTNLLAWQQDGEALSAAQAERLDRHLALAKTYLSSPNDPWAAQALVSDLSDPAWPDALDAEQAGILKAMLLNGEGDEVLAPSSASAFDGLASHQSAPLDSVSGSEPFVGADRVSETAPVVEPSAAADSQVHEVSDELLAMLASEMEGLRESLDEALDAAVIGAAQARAESLDGYREIVGRVGVAAEAVGALGLKRYFDAVLQSLADATSIDAGQADLLKTLPGLVAAYLGSPTDPSTAEGLVDLLRSGLWATLPTKAAGDSLVAALCAVRPVKGVSSTPTRALEARPEDVAVALPDTISQELVDGLLQDLQVRTTEFSEAVQRIAAGEGTLDDVDQAKRAAHTLKGAASTAGVRGIANLTHHLEDILIAFSKHQALPNGALSEMLSNASDCLEAMSEAVTGAGPEPDDALAVLQSVLDWANRIDREGIPDSTQPAAKDIAAERVSANAADASGEAAAAQEPMVRVPAALIDELLRLVGETMISTTQIRDRARRIMRQTESVQNQNGAFLQLANELEHLVDVRGVAAPFLEGRESEDFDPLEFEHYSELHTVSRRMIESATDSRELGVGVKEDIAALNELLEGQERLHLESQGVVMRTRMVPVSTIVSRLQRSVRQACRVLDKRVDMQVVGAETLVDSNILNELVDPLMHMLRNSVDHGIEAASARQQAGKAASGHIVVRCRDDGAGLDRDAIRRSAEAKGLVKPEQALSDDELDRLILRPGFSTRTQATEVSGRGIGMDVVYSRILQMKGSLNLRSSTGRGLLTELRVPAALLSTHALLVRSALGVLAVSSHGIEDIHYVMPEQLQALGAETTYRVGDSVCAVKPLSDLLGASSEEQSDKRSGFPALLVRQDSGAISVVRVPEIVDSRDLVVKNLGQFVPKTQGVVGATILGDGAVAPVIDLPELMRAPLRAAHGASAGEGDEARENYSRAVAHSQLSALIVDDSLSARRATAQFMKDAGFEVRTAIDGLEAVSLLEKWVPDILLVDMEMPRMNGLELASHVRARKELANVPIVMITSRSTDKHRKQAQSAGVNVYLTKPFSDDELLRHVTELTAS
jgi:chemosensory pili system protein ChpA (sensor histidine kinase/response regulator)